MARAESTRPFLKLVDSATGEFVETDRRLADLEDKVVGLQTTIERQARLIGQHEREKAKTDPRSDPRIKELDRLIERWKRATGHERSKNSKDRLDLIRARLKDGYTVEQIELAIDGLAACPYVVDAQRSRTGHPSQRYDQLEHCLKGGARLERFAVLGHRARKAGAVTWGEEA